MKFEAVTNKNKFLTERKIYHGNVVTETETVNEKITTELKIAVYNDNEKWRSYPASYFIPYDGE